MVFINNDSLINSEPVGRAIDYTARVDIPKINMIELERARKDADAPEDATIKITPGGDSSKLYDYCPNSSSQTHLVTFSWTFYV